MSVTRRYKSTPPPSPPPLLLLVSVLTSLLAAIPVLQASSPSAGPGVRILRPPESTVAPSGDEVVFVCETSLPPDHFEWSYASTRSQAPRFKYLKSSSAKNNSNITITHDNDISKLRVIVRTETLGEYRCVAWFGPLAVTSTTARLELATISGDNMANRAHWRVAAGNTVLWHCGQVMSNPAPTWSFYYNDIEMPAVSTLSDSNGTLLLPHVSTASSGTYSCAATNTASSQRLVMHSRLELQVPAAALPSAAPALLHGQGVRTEVLARIGETVLLLCPGVGYPPPTAVWSSPNVPGAVYNNRTRVLPYGLQISGLQPKDGGTYICYLDNGIRPALEHFIQLVVQQAPRIVRPPSANLTNEGEFMELECAATGTPTPKIYWLLNGEHSVYDTEAELPTNGSLILRRVLKRHAGYVQCFARNVLGEHSAGTLLQVNPTQIQAGEGNGTGMGGRSSSSRPTHNRKQKQMVPPSAPNVTRLSDESVMLRWHVVRNDGLHIQFFKVQYRMLTDSGKRKTWQTTNDNIPYGKQRHDSDAAVRNFTSSVTGLRPDRSYRFRIMAVYSNNDNKESNTSGKFYLQRGATLAPLPVPELLDIKEYSQTAVVLYWHLPSDADEQSISGYYAYYRPSASAGEYLKATIDGAKTRSFQISALEPGTIYEFKLQSFSAMSASEFSALKQGRTQRPRSSTTAQPTMHTLDTTTPSHNETFNMNPLLTGTIGGGALLILLVISACLCLCRRRNSRGNNSQNKPRLAELREDFVPLNTCSPNKPRTRHIHITLNPLAQQQQQQLQQQQHDEKDSQDNDLGYFQRQPVVYDAEALGFNGLARMSSSSLRRSQRTLERAAAGGGSGGNNNNLNQATDASLAASLDSPRLQASNKPGRVILKRARLSSRSENLSSGSLNSVGV
ncbi:interference hedgehog [Drosophila hydei]|uniref:Interference hedgehog n=1 Tax=Drosophila hydei TaxID=7224 RepID=A0A6J1MI49_DROHY|nr:interference hedgehog [Drosophila hydei]XP_023179114.2 interference hedgehog [Drosophila hydei]XP_023179115.2 interference hedgehog [Drosophila hydei]